MDTNNDNRNYDRDQDQQRQDRDQNRNPQQSSGDQQQGGRNSDHQRGNSGNSSRDIESRWQDIESDYRKRYDNLTDEDVNYRDGDFDSMTNRIAKRTNRNQNDVNDEIQNWTNS